MALIWPAATWPFWPADFSHHHRTARAECKGRDGLDPVYLDTKGTEMSNRLKALREKRAETVEAAEAITAKAATEKRISLNDAERAAHDTALAEIKTLDKDIAGELEIIAAKAATAAAVPGSPDPARPALSGARSIITPLKNIKGADAETRAFRAGHFFLASSFGNEKSIAWCRENGLLVQRAASEGINSAGGYLVPEEMQSEIIILRNEYGLARRDLKVVPMGRDTITTPKLVSGLTMYYTSEGVAPTASQPVFSNVRLTAKKGSILTLWSSELDEDSVVSLGDLLTGEVAYAFAAGEDNALFSGDGTSTYGGITGLRKIFNDGVGTLAGAVDGASGNDTMAEMTAADLARCQGALPQYVYVRGNPKWYCSQTMWANVFERLIGASGGVTKDQASGRTIREYNGYPVEITPAMLAPAAPTTDTSDVAMILFGDLNMSASMGDRRGMTISRSTEYKFAEDQIAIKGTERFDINCHNLGDATNAGSIVALMGE
jgi:HK97 family phage major capsid protein